MTIIIEFNFIVIMLLSHIAMDANTDQSGEYGRSTSVKIKEKK